MEGWGMGVEGEDAQRSPGWKAACQADWGPAVTWQGGQRPLHNCPWCPGEPTHTGLSAMSPAIPRGSPEFARGGRRHCFAWGGLPCSLQPAPVGGRGGQTPVLGHVLPSTLSRLDRWKLTFHGCYSDSSRVHGPFSSLTLLG